MFGHIFGPSRDALPPQDSARPEFAPRGALETPDPSGRPERLARRSVVLSDARDERTLRHLAASTLSVGSFLSLVSVGLVATATIGVFFGTGFLLLVPPAGGTISSSGTWHPGREARPLVHGLLPPPDIDHRHAIAKLGPVAAEPPVPGSDEAIPSSLIRVAPNPVADKELPPERNGAAPRSADLPAVREGLVNAAEDTLSPRELQAGALMPDAPRGVPAHSAQSAATPDPAPTSSPPPPRARRSPASPLPISRSFWSMGMLSSARAMSPRHACFTNAAPLPETGGKRCG
jgi:hypothetical protein